MTKDDDSMNRIRQEIDRVDEEIVRLLNERAEEVLKLVDLKKQAGLPMYMPAREDEVLRLVQEENKGPLTDDAIRRLFERIIDESRLLERAKAAGEGEGE